MPTRFRQVQTPSFVKDLERAFTVSGWSETQKQYLKKKVKQVFTVTQQHPLTKAFGCSDEKLSGSRRISQALKEILGNNLKLRKARFNLPDGGGSASAFLRLIFVVNLTAKTVIWINAFTHATHGKHEKTINPKIILELLIDLKRRGTIKSG